jgi:hypothetical protein
MKTYTVIYAEDIPHYAMGEIEARSPKAAIAKARKMDTDTFGAYDADWNNVVCRRIVSVEDPDDNIIAQDIRLDDFHLERGTDEDIRIRDAAADMLVALETLIERSDDLESAIAGVTDQFERQVARLSEAASAAEKIVKTARGQS